MALPWIGVALRVRFERDRSVDGARLRGSETDRHAALSALLNVSSPTALPEMPMTCGLVGSLSVMVTAPG